MTPSPKANSRRLAPTLLLVEADSPSRTLLARRLRGEGWNVVETGDGPAALAMLEHMAVAAVLLDIGLPGMNGLAVLQAIRRKRAVTELPVLMITAFDTHAYLTPALEAGANDFVNKPIDFAILRARLRTHLGLTSAVAEAADLRKRQALILKGSNDGIWEWDLREDRLLHSARWRELIGIPPSETLSRGEHWLQRVHPGDQVRVRAEFRAFRDDPQADFFRCEYRVKTGDDDYLWVQTRGAAWRDAAGACIRVAGTHTDISALRYINRFTGLPNLQRVTDMLARNLERAGRANGSVGLVLIRLWDLEHQAAHMGKRHAFIRELAEALDRHLRPFDVIGSGEHAEHLILLAGQNLHSVEELMRMTQRGLEIANADIGIHVRQMKYRVSAGIAYFHGGDAPDAEEIIAAAGLAAEAAHEQGLPMLCFDSQLQERIERRQQLAAELGEAIENGAVAPWWQPIVYADGRLAGFETLARWKRADGSCSPPAEFIPLAESSGLLHRLTERMLERSLAALAGWKRTGQVGGDAYIAINFPSSLLEDAALPDHLRTAIRTHGLLPRNLCIEVTESAAVNDTPETQERLLRLRHEGFRLALDDFGTGYASLSMLHRLPFDTLKIDQSFVRVMHDQASVRELVNAIIAMARALDLQLVAEGVETEQQAAILRAAGVDRLQGYLHAHPMSETALLAWLQGTRRSEAYEEICQ